ncbi:hypothetical protein [Spiroplasma turonicum]|uniref:Uncharacterized protein n=1 Tax=Spiroplasma turonicum TaxID=216946 RepID=A0A0K1P859_9MOLU|nr:hypothetical protein [Spiroplasma turonicum]AKU80072.1 hypothetical protein STURON_00826 [Spiroplasma turonicum]ALX71074.1 hypothetical protein STURO_v1c08230 [Spiroplasma turonicum]
MAAEKKHFQSILDYRPQFENIIDALVPDIQFSYSAIMNNTTIQTYFNMLSMEYYGYEYFQIMRLNKLEFKLNDRTLNLTVLEMVYNILLQIIDRKWRYSEYIAYDMYILPLRIRKYINAMNYRFIETETANQKPIFKLVSQETRVLIEDLVDQFQDDRLNNIIGQFRACAPHELEQKLILFKNLLAFVYEGKTIVNQRFGQTFSEIYYKDVYALETIKSDSMTTKDKKFVSKVIDEVFNISIIVILLMSDSMKTGIWKKVIEKEKRRVEMEMTRKAIEDANRRLEAIAQKEKEVQKLETKK